MAISFTELVDHIEYQLGFIGPASGYPEMAWDRSLNLVPWANQALQSFPLLKPRQEGYTLIETTHTIDMPTDFVDIMSVEYPAHQEPPVYLFRLNYLEKGFYTNKQTFYDVDRNYITGIGNVLIISTLLQPDDHLHVNYLKYHDHELLDNLRDAITVPDQYEDILITYVVAKAYRSLMTVYVADPTSHENLITEMVELIDQAETKYHKMIANLLSNTITGNSVIPPNRTVDKFDRVY